jgi:hypothetical protein
MSEGGFWCHLDSEALVFVEFEDIEIGDVGVDEVPFADVHFLGGCHGIDDLMFKIFIDRFWLALEN